MTPPDTRPAMLFVCLLVATSVVRASDHADPIDPLRFQRQEARLTDLFVFPVDADGVPTKSFQRSANLPLNDTLADIVREPLNAKERADIAALVFILCIHRSLENPESIELSPYTFQIHIDYTSKVKFPTQKDIEQERAALREPLPPGEPEKSNHHGIRPKVVEAYARYGGKIADFEGIQEEVTLCIRLENTGELRSLTVPKTDWNVNRIELQTGVFDDPFSFPAFNGMNVFAVILKVPIDMFPPDADEFLVWATSQEGHEQIDHVGRSLRTQNPRFDLLNTLHPSEHEAAIHREHEHPSLMRDLALRFNLSGLFAYRSWDFVPDVLIYSKKYPVGFPNGRLVTDDVAAILAQHGDTQLYELSYEGNASPWPRRGFNDVGGIPQGAGTTKPRFPYLQPAHENSRRPEPVRLTTSSKWKLVGFFALLLLLLLLWSLVLWLLARRWYRTKPIQRYL